LLAAGRGEDENGPVQASTQAKLAFTALAFLALTLCLPATALGQNRDTRGAPKNSATTPPHQGPIDINHATVEDLLEIPGLTRTWGLRIVRFRPYRSKQDLLEQGVVSSEVYARIKDYVIAHRAP
jgi:DNA uptake protein ComE-like DNA-binding protein